MLNIEKKGRLAEHLLAQNICYRSGTPLKKKGGCNVKLFFRIVPLQGRGIIHIEHIKIKTCNIERYEKKCN